MYFYNTKLRYNRFSDHLRDKFGTKVYKVTLDAGFTCPNRDGTISNEGCIFCDDGGSFSQLYSNKISIKEQLDSGIALSKEKYKAEKFLAYFQAYTNTYKPVNELKEIYPPIWCSLSATTLSGTAWLARWPVPPGRMRSKSPSSCWRSVMKTEKVQKKILKKQKNSISRQQKAAS